MLAQRLSATLQSIENAASASHRPTPRLLAVSKTQSATAVAALAAAGQHAFGENYVQEAQSNKAEVAATVFDWVQTVDRAKLIPALARHRPSERAPLNVLIQVNIDDEASKHGCAPVEVPALVAAIVAEPRLRLRGLMAIPAPHPDIELRRDAYRRMADLFKHLALQHPGADTLSMGMSDDFALAIAEGATMVRVGTALFGRRE